MDRITLPTNENLIALRVKKIKRNAAILEVEGEGVDFNFPLELLPQGIAEGEKLNFKVFNEVAQNENSNVFARKLLEEIIN